MDVSTAVALPLANPQEFLVFILAPGFLILDAIRRHQSKDLGKEPYSLLGDGLTVIALGFLAFIVTSIFLQFSPLPGYKEYLYTPLKMRMVGLYVLFFSSAFWFMLFLINIKKIKEIQFSETVSGYLLLAITVLILSLVVISVPLIAIEHVPLSFLISPEPRSVIVNTLACDDNQSTIELQVVNYYDSPMVFRAYAERINNSVTRPIAEIGKQVVLAHEYKNITATVHATEFIYLNTNYGLYAVPLKCGYETFYGQKY